MEQLELAARVAPQAFAPVPIAKSDGLAPAIVIPVMFRVALPVLDRLAVIAALVVPTVKLPNGTVAGVREATGAGGAVPSLSALKSAANPLRYRLPEVLR